MAELNIQDCIVIVDDDLLEELSKRTWFIGADGYVVANEGRGRQVRMHHLVIGRPPETVDLSVTDHINANKLDNRRENLRHVSNRYNTKRAFFHTKGYYLRKDNGRWQVNCRWPGIVSGSFKTEEEAKARVSKIREEIEKLNAN